MEYNSKDITCPYCRGTFKHDGVHFRLSRYEDSRKLDEKMRKLTEESDPKRRKQRQREIQRIKKRMRRTGDAKLADHWKKYGFSIPGTGIDGEEEYARPAFEAGDSDFLFHNSRSDSWQLDNTGDGGAFLWRVWDCYGELSAYKLCPHCHNKLPYYFGQHEVYKIALLGNSDSGKTVYMRVVEREIKSILAKAGLMLNKGWFIPDNAPHYEKAEGLEDDGDLPEGTRGLKQPIFLDVKQSLDGGRCATLVIYDMEGEKFTGDTKEFANYVDSYLDSCDAAIFLMEPGQFPEFANGENTVPVDDILSKLEGVSKSQKGKIAAVVLSKSDEIAERIEYGHGTIGDAFQRNDVIFSPIRDAPVGGFDKKSYGYVRGGMCYLLHELDKNRVLRNRINNIFGFENVSYFAVSSLGHDAEVRDNGSTKKTAGTIAPRRIEEPFLWVLYKLGLIQGIE